MAPCSQGFWFDPKADKKIFTRRNWIYFGIFFFTFFSPKMTVGELLFCIANDRFQPSNSSDSLKKKKKNGMKGEWEKKNNDRKHDINFLLYVFFLFSFFIR